MRKMCIFFMVLLMLAAAAHAGHISQQWNITYGGSNIDASIAIYQTMDGGYILAGFTDSFGVGGFGIWAVKLNSNGAITWQKVYMASVFDIVNSFKQTGDGGYILAGFTFPPSSTTAMALIIKLDSQGEIVWNKIYREVIEFKFIEQTSDGGYITCGRDYILKIDSGGDVSWSYGYPSAEFDRILETNDGGYIVSGNNGSGYDVLIRKFDSSGNTVWQKTYGGYVSPIGVIERTADDEYFITGYTYSYGTGETDALLMKLNGDGDILWQKVYDGGPNDCGFTSIKKTSDGGYLVGGEFSSALRNKDLWLLKLDSNGDPLWEKTYGGSGFDGVASIQNTSDGGYIVMANTQSFGAGNNDLWVLKLNSNGYIPDCDIIGTSDAMVLNSTVAGMATNIPIESSPITVTEANIILWNASVETSAVCYYEDPNDIDGDGVETNPIGVMTSSRNSSSLLAVWDNCSDMPNGPYLGTCTKGDLGGTCIAHAACGVDGFCSMIQEDSYPPQGNSIGDACECEGNFNCSADQDVDGSDAATFKVDFGRNSYNNPCIAGHICNGDFSCDGDVDGTDAALFKQDFGRSQFSNPCPACASGVEWCGY